MTEAALLNTMADTIFRYAPSATLIAMVGKHDFKRIAALECEPEFDGKTLRTVWGTFIVVVADFVRVNELWIVDLVGHKATAYPWPSIG
jgi:hypothetical protein